jgi:hypothetical protein
MVMDVEGTDGRERGEDQVLSCPLHVAAVLKLTYCVRTLSASRRSFPSPLRRSLLSTFGNTRLVYTKAQIWAY